MFTFINRTQARLFTGAVMVAMLLSMLPIQAMVAEAASADLEIDLMPNPTGNDFDEEYFTLTLSGSGTLNLDGWTVTDAATFTYTFGPADVLSNGDSVTVCANPVESNVPCDYEWSGGFIWNDSGDTFTLFDETDTEVGSFSYGNVGADNDNLQEDTFSVTTSDPDPVERVDGSGDNDDATFASIQAAIDDADTDAGDTILLLEDITTSAQVTITKAIILDGDGYTLDAAFTKTDNSNNSAVGVQSDDVTVHDLIVDGTNGTDLHGINVYESTGVVIDTVTAISFRSGIGVNSSEVTARNITTSGNVWHGINVDKRTSMPASLTIEDVSAHDENSPNPPSAFSDGTHVAHIFVDDATEGTVINDVDNQYDTAEVDFRGGRADVYTLKTDTDDGKKVDICHWNGNTFNLLNVNVNSIGTAHGGAGTNDGDIIPVLPDYAGQNLGTDYSGYTGAEVLANDCEIPVDSSEDTATVTMCKVDIDDEPLSDWTLMLKDGHVEDVVVPANTLAGANTVNSLTSGTSYIAEATGTWSNAGGNGGSGNVADAEYVTTDGWSSYTDGPAVGPNNLDLQIMEQFRDWGVYNGAHVYADGFVPAVDGNVNFRIFDGTGSTPNNSWYNDNSGSLDVSIYEGYAGVTDGNGCVTFEDVPYGTYTADEIMQEGWTNVSGLGEVIVDESEETFTVKNVEGDLPPANECLIEGYKYDEDGEPLKGWFIGLAKAFTFSKDTPWFVGFDWTDKDGYYCIQGYSKFPKKDLTGDWMEEKEDSQFTSTFGQDFGVTHFIFEVLKEGWSPVKVVVDGQEVAYDNWTDEDVHTEIDLSETDIVNFYNTEGEVPDESDYAPYCGDGEVNQDWEQCEIGQEGCTNYCLAENQCHTEQLVKINLDNASEGISFEKQIYLGTSTNPIPNDTWFKFDVAGDAPAQLTANAVLGLAVERDQDDGSLKLAFEGGNGSKKLDKFIGEIDVLGLDSDGVTESVVPGYSLEDGSGASFDDVFDVSGGTHVDFDMRADTGSDGVTWSLVPDDEQYDCPPFAYQCEVGMAYLDVETGGTESSSFYTVSATSGVTTLRDEYNTDMESVLAIDVDGDVFSIEKPTGNLLKLESAGSYSSVGNTGIGDHPVAMEFAPDGTLYVLSQNSEKLYEVNPTDGTATELHDFSGELDINGGDVVFTDYDVEETMLYIDSDGIVHSIDMSTYSTTAVGDLEENGVIGAAYEDGTYYVFSRNDRMIEFTYAPFVLGDKTISAGPFAYGDGASCPLNWDDDNGGGNGGNGDDGYTLTIEVNPDNGASGVVEGIGINCGTGDEQEDCTETYATSTDVELTVSLGPNSTFDGSWTLGHDSCNGTSQNCTITMDEDVDLVAHIGFSGGVGGTTGGYLLSSTSGGGGGIPQVAGAQTSVLPLGGANAGTGGATNDAAGRYAWLVVVGLMIGAAVLKRTRSRHAR